MLVERSQFSLQNLVLKLIWIENDLSSVSENVLFLRIPLVNVEIFEEKLDLSQCGHGRVGAMARVSGVRQTESCSNAVRRLVLCSVRVEKEWFVINSRLSSSVQSICNSLVNLGRAHQLAPIVDCVLFRQDMQIYRAA